MTQNVDIVKQKVSPHPKAKVSGGVMEFEAVNLLKNFFDNKRE